MSDTVRTSIADELKNGQNVVYFTVGVSMRPLLYERKTHVMIVPAGQVRNGDIVLYVRKNGAQVLHRCIRQDERYCYMRGDNTLGLEPVEKNRVFGVVTHIYRKGKQIDVRENRLYRMYVSVWNLMYPLRWMVKKCWTAGKCLLKGALRRLYVLR